MKLELPLLNFDYSALEPYIDKQTVDIHYNKHHANYLSNFLKLIDELDIDLSLFSSAENLYLYIRDKANSGDNIYIKMKNNLGGFLNHNIYWEILDPKKQLLFENSSFLEVLSNTGYTKDKFIEYMVSTGVSLFGSGWLWGVLKDGKIRLVQTVNQDHYLPLDTEKVVFAIDLWENAYHLNYQNRRADYLSNMQYTIRVVE